MAVHAPAQVFEYGSVTSAWGFIELNIKWVPYHKVHKYDFVNLKTGTLVVWLWRSWSRDSKPSGAVTGEQAATDADDGLSDCDGPFPPMPSCQHMLAICP